MARWTCSLLARLCQAAPNPAGRLLTDSEIPMSVENIIPKKGFKDDEIQEPFPTGKLGLVSLWPKFTKSDQGRKECRSSHGKSGALQISLGDLTLDLWDVLWDS